MFKLTFERSAQRQLNNMAEWTGKFRSSMLSQDVMDSAVKYIGRDIDRKFRTEGSSESTGKWQNLSPLTQDVREFRGYPRAHPILQQSGALRNLAAGKLVSWGIGTRSFAGGDGDGTRMTAWTSQSTFNAKISGPKVVNHFGGANEEAFFSSRIGVRNPGKIPARPFFGFGYAATLQARDAIIEKGLLDWARKSRTAKRV